MERYAFIDVANTKGTAKTLGFFIDWQKLASLLKGEKWACLEVFYYEGMMDGKKFEKKKNKLEAMGYSVKSKTIFLHKNRDKNIKFLCDSCQSENSFQTMEFSCAKCTTIKAIPLNNGGTHPKANFDVEIAVDAIDYIKSDREFLFLTGDGDFRYLAEKLISRDVLVSFVSSKKTTPTTNKRFSTRLQELITQEELLAKKADIKSSRVRLIEIDNWKNLIQKEK